MATTTITYRSRPAAAPAARRLERLPEPERLELRALILTPDGPRLERLEGLADRPHLEPGEAAMRLPGYWPDERVRRFLRRHGVADADGCRAKLEHRPALADVRLAARRALLDDSGLQEVTDLRLEALHGDALLVLETGSHQAGLWRVTAVAEAGWRRAEPQPIGLALHVAAAWGWILAA